MVIEITELTQVTIEKVKLLAINDTGNLSYLIDYVVIAIYLGEFLKKLLISKTFSHKTLPNKFVTVDVKSI
jgi:hypothetical protein